MASPRMWSEAGQSQDSSPGLSQLLELFVRLSPTTRHLHCWEGVGGPSPCELCQGCGPLSLGCWRSHMACGEHCDHGWWQTMDIGSGKVALSLSFHRLQGLLGGNVQPVVSSSLGRCGWQLGRGRLSFQAAGLPSARAEHPTCLSHVGTKRGPLTKHRRGEKGRVFTNLAQRGQQAKVETALGL